MNEDWQSTFQFLEHISVGTRGEREGEREGREDGGGREGERVSCLHSKFWNVKQHYLHVLWVIYLSLTGETPFHSPATVSFWTTDINVLAMVMVFPVLLYVFRRAAHMNKQTMLLVVGKLTIEQEILRVAWSALASVSWPSQTVGTWLWCRMRLQLQRWRRQLYPFHVTSPLRLTQVFQGCQALKFDISIYLQH